MLSIPVGNYVCHNSTTIQESALYIFTIKVKYFRFILKCSIRWESYGISVLMEPFQYWPHYEVIKLIYFKKICIHLVVSDKDIKEALHFIDGADINLPFCPYLLKNKTQSVSYGNTVPSLTQDNRKGLPDSTINCEALTVLLVTGVTNFM